MFNYRWTTKINNNNVTYERFIEKKKIYNRYIKDEEIKIKKLNKELEDPNIR